MVNNPVALCVRVDATIAGRGICDIWEREVLSERSMLNGLSMIHIITHDKSAFIVGNILQGSVT